MFECNFVDGCLLGCADPKNLDVYIDYWHTHETGNILREFLGMSQSEFEKWLASGDIIIPVILRCRADNVE